MNRNKFLGGLAAVVILSASMFFLIGKDHLTLLNSRIAQGIIIVIAIMLMILFRRFERNNENFELPTVMRRGNNLILWTGLGLVICAAFWFSTTLVAFSTYQIPPSKGTIIIILPAALLAIAGTASLVYWVILRLLR
jgi:hypothetical protein